jgi:hypothetical protein
LPAAVRFLDAAGNKLLGAVDLAREMLGRDAMPKYAGAQGLLIYGKLEEEQ